MIYGKYPQTRMRRQRQAVWIRRMVAETELTTADLILPLFVHGEAKSENIKSMPGVARHSIKAVVEIARRAFELGIPAIALFPVVPESLKTEDGKEAVNPDNLICRTIREVKAAMGDKIGIIADVALDPYTTHGHDGLLENGKVVNDRTVDVLHQQAKVLASAGADIIAPSDMMDGRVGAIREALDEAGFSEVMILSYAAKYASSFYGPFREAVGSAGHLKGDKQTYQMDPRNTDEAIREVALDIEEGADMVMIKPGLPYLDIIRRIRDEFKIHVYAYQVSGEYAMIRAAADAGYVDYHQAMMESLIAMKRAGAIGIFTYAALEAAEYIKVGSRMSAVFPANQKRGLCVKGFFLYLLISLSFGANAAASEVVYQGLNSIPAADVIIAGKLHKSKITSDADNKYFYFEIAPQEVLKGEIKEHKLLKLVYSESDYSKMYDPKLGTIPFSPIFSGSGHEFQFKEDDEVIVFLDTREVIKDADFHALAIEPISEKENIIAKLKQK